MNCALFAWLLGEPSSGTRNRMAVAKRQATDGPFVILLLFTNAGDSRLDCLPGGNVSVGCCDAVTSRFHIGATAVGAPTGGSRAAQCGHMHREVACGLP